MAEVAYTLCALTALLCTWLLLRGYYQTRYKLLLWGGLCFLGLTLNNALLIIDKLVLPTQVNLFTWRLVLALSAMIVLLYGLIWDSD
jgi:Family of unknown function (DUF5985)